MRAVLRPAPTVPGSSSAVKGRSDPAIPSPMLNDRIVSRVMTRSCPVEERRSSLVQGAMHRLVVSADRPPQYQRIGRGGVNARVSGSPYRSSAGGQADS
jgi:hypothetical protein